MPYCPNCGFAMGINEIFCGNCGFNTKNTLSINNEERENSSDKKDIGSSAQYSPENVYQNDSTKITKPKFNYCQDCGHAEVKGVLYCQVCKSERLKPNEPKGYFPPKNLEYLVDLQIVVAAFNLLIGIIIIFVPSGLESSGFLIFGIIYTSMALIVLISLSLLVAKVALRQGIFRSIFFFECFLNFGIGTIIGIPMLIYFGRPRVKAFLSNPYFKEVEDNAI
jgi:hypothetical protein